MGFIIILILILALVYGGNHFYNFALNRNVKKDAVIEGNDHDTGIDRNLEENMVWFDKQKNEVSIVSNTGKEIVGYEFLNDSDFFIIVLHGYGEEGRKMATYVRKFFQKGYNVLAVDLLAHGKSGGETITMGSLDSEDIPLWCDFINENHKDKKIILFGISMGAATVMNSLDKNLPKNVVGFIEDSGYVRLDEMFDYQWEKLFSIPKFPLLNMASLVTKIRGGFSFDSVNSIEGLRETTIPGLIIHGDKDDFVPLENAFIAFENLRSREKEIYIFPDLGHVEAAIKAEDEYWNEVFQFLSTKI